MKEQGGIIDEKGAEEVEVDDGDDEAESPAAAAVEEEEPELETQILCRPRRDAERAAARRSMVANKEEERVCRGKGRGGFLLSRKESRGKNRVETLERAILHFWIYSQRLFLARGRNSLASPPPRHCSAHSFPPFFSAGDRPLMAFSSRAVSAPSRVGQVRRERGEECTASKA